MIAKFLSVDPLSPEYPWYTPYQFAGNKPIAFVDLDGQEEVHFTITMGIETKFVENINRNIPFSYRWNYSYRVAPELATSSAVSVVESADEVYNLTIRVPSKAQLAGKQFVVTRYDNYSFSGSDLGELENESKWVKQSNLGSAFRDGMEVGLMTGLGEGLLDDAIKAAGMRGLVNLAGRGRNILNQFVKAEALVQKAVLKIAAKNPRVIQSIERIIKNDSGRTLGDFDIETDRFIIEVASGKGTGKATQILDRLQNISGGREVILFGTKKLSGTLEKRLKEAGVKVFRDADKLADYVTKKK